MIVAITHDDIVHKKLETSKYNPIHFALYLTVTKMSCCDLQLTNKYNKYWQSFHQIKAILLSGMKTFLLYIVYFERLRKMYGSSGH